MGFPAFFAQAPVITLHDPLAVFLGVSADGEMTYAYEDAVKLAGHSCPTVAGSYLMARRGLQILYPHEVPERGNIEVFMRDERDAGVTGVIATIVMLVTGAAPETGFAGIGGRFRRSGLLHFDAPIEGLMALRRRDTGQGVELDLNTGAVPPDPEMQMVFPHVVSGRGDADDLRRFGELWQDRVGRMLTEHADDDTLIVAREWQLAA